MPPSPPLRTARQSDRRRNPRARRRPQRHPRRRKPAAEIRWLRPEFQAATQGDLTLTTRAAKPAKIGTRRHCAEENPRQPRVARRSPCRSRGRRRRVAAPPCPRPFPLPNSPRTFARGKKEAVAEILSALVVLGRAHRGRSAGPTRRSAMAAGVPDQQRGNFTLSVPRDGWRLKSPGSLSFSVRPKPGHRRLRAGSSVGTSRRNRRPFRTSRGAMATPASSHPLAALGFETARGRWNSPSAYALRRAGGEEDSSETLKLLVERGIVPLADEAAWHAARKLRSGQPSRRSIHHRSGQALSFLDHTAERIEFRLRRTERGCVNDVQLEIAARSARGRRRRSVNS